ncbi:MAG TPA: BolA family protein [Rickettsiales bacterium]|nr:BolA family protein [Rickettsiales bacterium]
MTTRADHIRNLLQTTLNPQKLEIRDDSAKHAGHAGARPEGETHFRVEIVSDKFTGLSRVARHRLVNEALAPLFPQGLHALEIIAKSPQE